MIALHLLSLAASSLAIRITIPDTFGGKSDYADHGWRVLIDSLSKDVFFGKMPSKDIPLGAEPTCFESFIKCRTTYFLKESILNRAETALLWVKWHQDITPLSCDSPDGCTIAATTSVADLSSQTRGWSVMASLNAHTGIKEGVPSLEPSKTISLSVQYSEQKTISTTISSSRALTARCIKGNVCFLETGTLMVAISGPCTVNPLIVCNERMYPCTDYKLFTKGHCSQWSDFTKKYCKPLTKKPLQICSLDVAITTDDNMPVTFQVFQQKPSKILKCKQKREVIPKVIPLKNHNEVISVEDHNEVISVRDHYEVISVEDHNEVISVEDHLGVISLEDQYEVMSLEYHYEVVPLEDHYKVIPLEDYNEEMPFEDHYGVMPFEELPDGSSGKWMVWTP